MGHAKSKRERMERVEHLLLMASDGISASEIARMLSCDPSTVHRYLTELELDYPLIEVARGRYRLDPTQYLANVRLSPGEALCVYLALRRYARQTTNAPDFVVTALQKIAQVLRHSGLTQQLGQSSLFLQTERLSSPEQTDIWKTILRGWLENIVIRIHYLKSKADEADEHEIEPYLFEPAVLSHGTYLIAWSRSRDALRTFKVHRIQRATLTTMRFVPRPDLDVDDLLKHAWGIWYGENPVKVELLFAPEVANRVQETLRHPSEQSTLFEDGSLYWTVEIVGVQELIAWIRGWGPAVRVLAPETLRRQIAADMCAAAALYEE